ncbi:MAG: type I-E CRISPR-associated protein Cse2/CasB [Candidatus Sumerlaeota bacterium]|nr:type I-E CRISPR-associated protein Cse2/CasB [Candidatus Sumerlaeota bacterium]
MSSKATEDYIRILCSLKEGDLGLLRKHAGSPLDKSVDAFDLFAGLWWPLREKNQRAPRRTVAWLVAKLYAFRPLAHQAGEFNYLAAQMGRVCRRDEKTKARKQECFDELLQTPLSAIEPMLQWALNELKKAGLSVDWAQLTDDLSIWEREKTRRGWAAQFLNIDKEEKTPC